MIVTVFTPFPELLEPFSFSGVIGKAVEKGLISIRCVNPRDHADGHYGQIDDYAFGGGGMVLMAEPLARAVGSAGPREGLFVIHPGPQGVVFGQSLAETLATKGHLVIVCGRYEGIDERFLEHFADLEISIGDYVLTGGELPAMVIIDAVARLIPGVVGQGEAVEEDSFFRSMLDTPHYTRPATWRGVPVPEVLTDGDHGKTRSWRRRQSITRTLARRPDLIARANIGPYLDRGVYVILVPATGEVSRKEAEALGGLCGSFGCERALLVVPVEEDRRQLQGDPELKVKVVPSAESALEWVRKREKEEPFVIAFGDEEEGSTHWLEAKRLALVSGRPVVFLVDHGTAGGAEKVRADAVLAPPRGGKDDKSLFSRQDRLVVLLDRFFGRR